MGRKALGEFEQQVLLVILRLGNEAYSVPIVAEIEGRTGREVATSAVYVALRRLEKKAMLTSRLESPEESGAPYPRRYFALTESAIEPLKAARRSMLSLWKDSSRYWTTEHGTKPGRGSAASGTPTLEMVPAEGRGRRGGRGAVRGLHPAEVPNRGAGREAMVPAASGGIRHAFRLDRGIGADKGGREDERVR